MATLRSCIRYTALHSCVCVHGGASKSAVSQPVFQLFILKFIQADVADEYSHPSYLIIHGGLMLAEECPAHTKACPIRHMLRNVFPHSKSHLLATIVLHQVCLRCLFKGLEDKD